MKNKGIFLSLLLAAIMMFTLAACSGDDSADDPNLGKYEGQSAEMSGFTVGVDQLFEEGISVELKKKGKGKIYCDGASDSIKWTLDGSDFHAEGGGNEYDGTLSDGVMVLENILDSGMSVTLVCDDVVASSKGSSDEGDDGERKEESKLGKKDKSRDDSGSGESSDFSGSKEEAYIAAKTGTTLSGSDDNGGDTGAGESGSGGFSGMFDGSDDAGEWELYVVVEKGRTYMQDELIKKGIHSTIWMNDDGTGRIDLVGRLMDMEWEKGQIVVPDNGEGKREEYTYTITNNEFLVLVDGEMVLTFKRKE